MALPINTFVIKDRLESVEKKLDQVLEDEGVHNLAKDIIKKSMSSYLTTARGEINDIVKNAQTSIEKERKIATDFIFQEAEDRVKVLESKIKKSEMISRVAVIAAFASFAWDVITKFM
jgi:dsDNA-specific endonuclease/ATPase MutS2